MENKQKIKICRKIYEIQNFAAIAAYASFWGTIFHIVVAWLSFKALEMDLSYIATFAWIAFGGICLVSLATIGVCSLIARALGNQTY